MYTLIKFTKSSDNSDFRSRFIQEFYHSMIDAINVADRIMNEVPSDISTTHSTIVKSLKVIRSEVRNVANDLWSEDKEKLIGSIKKAYITTMDIKQEIIRLKKEVKDYYLTASMQQTEETKIQDKLVGVTNQCYSVLYVMRWLHEKVLDEEREYVTFCFQLIHHTMQEISGTMSKFEEACEPYDYINAKDEFKNEHTIKRLVREIGHQLSRYPSMTKQNLRKILQIAGLLKSELTKSLTESPLNASQIESLVTKVQALKVAIKQGVINVERLLTKTRKYFNSSY